MEKIMIYEYTNDFAEDKDIARDIRIKQIQPILNEGKKIAIDFSNIGSATQSFIHALISEVIRINGIEVLENLIFQNCNSRIQTIIEIVVEYVQDGIFTDNDDDDVFPQNPQ